MSAVQVSAELIERIAVRLDRAAAEVHGGLCLPIHDLPECPMTYPDRLLLAELRALLPQPAPTCPNCGHEDEDHRRLPVGEPISGVGCYAYQSVGGPECACAFSFEAVPQVRALLAAERDSKPVESGVCECGHSREAHCDHLGYVGLVAHGWHCSVIPYGGGGQCPCNGYRNGGAR